MEFKYQGVVKVEWINKGGTQRFKSITEEDIKEAHKHDFNNPLLKYMGDTVIALYKDNDDIVAKEFGHARIWKQSAKNFRCKDEGSSWNTGIVRAYKSINNFNEFTANDYL